VAIPHQNRGKYKTGKIAASSLRVKTQKPRGIAGGDKFAMQNHGLILPPSDRCAAPTGEGEAKFHPGLPKPRAFAAARGARFPVSPLCARGSMISVLTTLAAHFFV
jgi:hypothetical protein